MNPTSFIQQALTAFDRAIEAQRDYMGVLCTLKNNIDHPALLATYRRAAYTLSQMRYLSDQLAECADQVAGEYTTPADPPAPFQLQLLDLQVEVDDFAEWARDFGALVEIEE
jgi:hypothetical protein